MTDRQLQAGILICCLVIVAVGALTLLDMWGAW